MKVKEHYNLSIRDEKRVSAQVLKEAVLGVVAKSDDFVSQFEAHEKEVKSKIGIDYSKGTHKNYVATLKHLRNFLAQKYRGSIVTLKDLDYDFIEAFESYLKLDVGNSNNGAIKHIQRLKKVVHLAIKRGKIIINPFAAYKVKKEKSNREFLSAEELRTIEALQLANKTLEISLFLCFTCLLCFIMVARPLHHLYRYHYHHLYRNCNRCTLLPCIGSYEGRYLMYCHCSSSFMHLV